MYILSSDERFRFRLEIYTPGLFLAIYFNLIGDIIFLHKPCLYILTPSMYTTMFSLVILPRASLGLKSKFLKMRQFLEPVAI